MKLKKTLVAVMLVLTMLTVSVTALAAEYVVDVTKKGTISITLKESAVPHNVVKGASFKLYKVADLIAGNGAVNYALTEQFAESGVDLSDLRAEGISTHLAAFADQNIPDPVIANADADGKVLFSNLDLGLYLVVENGSVSGYFPTDPFIVSVPMTNADATAWVYEINASPKVQARPVPPPPTTELTVVKQWVGSDGNKPESISVSLLCDGAVAETVTLNEDNDWMYTWENLLQSNQWSVIEAEVPQNYKVNYSSSGTTTTIINTYQPDIPDFPESLTVNKVWDDGGREGRPGSVTVELRNGGVLYSSVELNAANNWTCTWNDLPESSEWSISEVGIPDDYEVSYAVHETTTTLTNKYVQPKKPKIVPTGQLDWPIPVLAVCGIVFIAVGYILLRTKRKKDADS